MDGSATPPEARVPAVLLPFLAGLLLAGCGPEPGSQAPAASEAAPRSLLLVTLDTVRADRVGCYGYDPAATPNLDRLAAEGVRFADVTAPAPLTLPAHATLLSGRTPPAHGLRQNGAGRLSEEVETVATRLAAAGYDTAAFVGAYVLHRRFGLDRGFAVYDDEVGTAEPGGAVRLESERPADRVVDRALAWLAARDDGSEAPGPFFLWLHLYDPHAPYEPPEPYRSRHRDPYDGEIAFADAQLGRLLDYLGAEGLAGEVAVAVAGDHGESLGDHGEATHGLLLYQPALAVPWLLRAPGVPAGRVVTEPVSLADVGPTVAGLLGHPLPTAPNTAGRDLTEALRGGGEPTAADLYAETTYPASFGWGPLAVLRRGELKYVEAPRPELYDLAADPGETRNLLAERRREARELRLRLEEMRSAAESAAPAADDVAGAVDDETRERLGALGYLAAGPARDPGLPLAQLPDPKTMVGLFERYEVAHRALEAGRTREALPTLEALVSEDPHNPVFRGGLARALQQLGELERAVELHRQAVADAPDDPDAWYNLAATLHQAGRRDEATEAVRQALLHDPGRPQARVLLGLLALGDGELEAARGHFEAALVADPGHAVAHNNLGNVLRAAGQRGEAAAAYRRAAELAPRYADPLNGLGTLAVEEDRPADAAELFRQALELDPDLHEARLNLGIARQLAGDRAGAAAVYRELLERTEGRADAAPQRRAAGELLAGLAGEAR